MRAIATVPSPCARPPKRCASCATVPSNAPYGLGLGEALSVMPICFSTSGVMSTPP
jgi:hypothetical protein